MEYSRHTEGSISTSPEMHESSHFYDLDPYPPFPSSTPTRRDRNHSPAKSDIVYTDIRGTIEIEAFDSAVPEGAGNGPSRTSQRIPGNIIQNPSTRGRIFSDANTPLGQAMSTEHRITSMEKVRDKFVTNNVRIQGAFFTDMWSNMKNSHPFFGMFTAEEFHPYKKLDRFLVLLASILLALILCGVFATQPCCSSTGVKSSPSVSGSRRLATTHKRILFQNRTSNDFTCHPFSSRCDERKRQLCTVGSTCQLLSGKSTRQCVPVVNHVPVCTFKEQSSVSSCPSGWICRQVGNPCVPNRSRVCYLPDMAKTSISMTADEGNGGGGSLISAIFNRIDIPDTSSSGSGSESSPEEGSGWIDPVAEPPTLPSSPPKNSSGRTPNKLSSGSNPASLMKGKLNNSTNSANNNKNPTSNSTPDAKNGTSSGTGKPMRFSLVKPSSGASYEIGSPLPIRWEAIVSEGEKLPIEAFTIQFSKDGSSDFRTIATDVKASEDTDNGPVFNFDWKLDEEDEDVLCEDCVLRICVSQPSTYATLCFQSDGNAGSSNNKSNKGKLAFRNKSNKGKLAFRIVQATKDACSKTCGVAYAKFVVYTFLIALSIPLSVLFLEEAVTFYKNSKFFGLITRRGSPHVPYLGSYQTDASRIGRKFLIFFICVLCLFIGVVLARVNSTNFYDTKNKIVQLWKVTFILTLLIGFLYCTIVNCIIFSIKWYADSYLRATREGSFTDLNMMLVPNSFVVPHPSI